MKFISYIGNRLKEDSTWGAFTAAVIAGAVVPSPYSWLAIGAAVIRVLVPQSGGTPKVPPQ